MSFYGWKPYVPVAKRRAAAARELAKLKKKGLDVKPVEVEGRRIAASFWGKGWCDHMESFSDFANRLPRGRTYVRNGSVCHLEIKPGRIEAIVSGSELYNIVVTVAPLAEKRWEAVKGACSGRIGSLIDLLRGKLADGVMEVVCHRETGLFPLPGEIRFECDCPDWADMCKHVAAVLYGVGARLDHAPEKLFLLRGVDHGELVDVTTAVGEAAGRKGSRRRIAATGISDVFGIDLAEGGECVAALPGKGDAPADADGKGEGKRRGRPRAEKGEPVREKRPARGTKGAGKAPAAEAPGPPPFPRTLTGNAIRAWRDSLGMTQGAFAAQVGVSAGCVSQWEKKGRQRLSVREGTLEQLKRLWLARGNGAKNPR